MYFVIDLLKLEAYKKFLEKFLQMRPFQQLQKRLAFEGLSP